MTSLSTFDLCSQLLGVLFSLHVIETEHIIIIRTAYVLHIIYVDRVNKFRSSYLHLLSNKLTHPKIRLSWSNILARFVRHCEA